MANVEPEVKIRLIALAEEMAKGSLPVATQRGEAGLDRYLEYFKKAYNTITEIVASK